MRTYEYRNVLNNIAHPPFFSMRIIKSIVECFFFLFSSTIYALIVQRCRRKEERELTGRLVGRFGAERTAQSGKDARQ